MSERHTFSRTLHDLGLSAWFGGSLMGAVGLNGAAAQASDPAERLSLSALGWKRWAPLNTAAIIAHGIGGVGLLLGNRERVRQQDGAMTNTVVKGSLTIVAAGLSAYSGVLGRKVETESHQGGVGATEPRSGASPQLAAAQRQLRMTQWAIPALTGILVILAAQQGEQQRPSQQLRDRLTG